MNGKKARLLRRMASSMGSALGKQNNSTPQVVARLISTMYKGLKKRYTAGARELKNV